MFSVRRDERGCRARHELCAEALGTAGAGGRAPATAPPRLPGPAPAAAPPALHTAGALSASPFLETHSKAIDLPSVAFPQFPAWEGPPRPAPPPPPRVPTPFLRLSHGAASPRPSEVSGGSRCNVNLLRTPAPRIVLGAGRKEGGGETGKEPRRGRQRRG